MRNAPKQLFPIALLGGLLALWLPGGAVAAKLCASGAVGLHDGPGATTGRTGAIAAGSCDIKIVGKCRSGWCPVSSGGKRGWADTRRITVEEGTVDKAIVQSSSTQAKKRTERRSMRPRPTRRAGGGSGLCVVHVAHDDTLRLRSGPGVQHRAISGIPPSACNVRRAGPCRGAWCVVDFNGTRGWVNATYLR